MSDDRAAALRADVAEMPGMLENLLDRYGEPGGPLAGAKVGLEARRVVLIGLGSSRYAALDVASAWRARGIAAWAEHASTNAPTPPDPGLVVIAISASGRTPEVVAAIERHRGTSLVVGITNAPDRPVGSRAHVVLPLLAGVEASGVSCRTFLATRAVLRLLGGATAAHLRPAVADLARLVGDTDAWVRATADMLDGADDIGVLAPAAALGLAGQMALMLREGPRLRAAAHETADWLHTGIYTALPGYRALLLSGSPADPEIERVVARRGGVLRRVPDLGNDLAASAIGDLLAAELWSRARAADASALASGEQG